MPRGCPRPKGPRNPVFRDFPSVGVHLAKTQNVKWYLRIFGEKLLGRTDFFSPKVPLAPGNCVFPFSARNFSKCPGAAPGQKGLKNQYFRGFPPVGVRSAKTQNVKKLHNFGEKLFGRTYFFSKSAPSSGKLCFSVFGPGPEFL